MRHALLLFFAIELAGCSQPNPAEADTAVSATTPSAADREPADTTATPPQGSIGSPNGPTPAASKLALDGEGLRIFNVASGAARPIPFGTAKTETMRIIETVLAAAPTEQGENLDCRATRATWADGLTAWFTDDRFVGWSLGDDSPTLTTAAGLTVGSTRVALESAYAADIAPSTLGTEFTAGGLAGLLDGDGADARVTNLWAGNACIAR